MFPSKRFVTVFCQGGYVGILLVNSIIYTVHTIHCTQYTGHCTHCTQYTLYTVYTLHSVHSTLTWYISIRTVQRTLCFTFNVLSRLLYSSQRLTPPVFYPVRQYNLPLTVLTHIQIIPDRTLRIISPRNIRTRQQDRRTTAILTVYCVQSNVTLRLLNACFRVVSRDQVKPDSRTTFLRYTVTRSLV